MDRWRNTSRTIPWLAAFLSFLWPGLGQLYAGRRRQALVFAVPALVVLLIVLFEARQGLDVLVARFVDPAFAVGALLIILALGALRIAAVVHAYLTAGGSTLGTPVGGTVRPPRARRNERAILGILVALILVTHGAGGALAYMDYSTWSQVFTPGVTDPSLPLSSDTPPPDVFAGGSQPPTSFLPTVSPTPIPGRITILITGEDSFPTRGEHLFDSIQIVSLDEATNKVAILSIPRDTAAFPLYYGGTVGPTMKINALVTYIQHGWIKSPDDSMTTLVREVGYLLGIPVDYYAIINLAGFMKLIDAVGGIDIVNPSVIVDPSYDWLNGKHGFVLSAGAHHLDGANALAFVRSRHGANNNDYMRASRQQQVMVALERKMASPNMIGQLQTVMQTVASSVKSNFPAGRVADMVALGDQIPAENITSKVLGPPWSDTGIGAKYHTSTSCLRLDKIAGLSVQLFGSNSRYYGLNQPDTCPAK